MITLTYVGTDFWGLPNYTTPKGTLVVDLQPQSEQPSLYRKTENDPDGEPDVPMKKGVDVTFIPERIRS